MYMKRDVFPVRELPNFPLLNEIVKEAHNQYLGFGLSPSKIAEIKYYINSRVNALIATGDWVTMAKFNDRLIVYKGIVVLQSDRDPSDLNIIPRWEYEEE